MHSCVCFNQNLHLTVAKMWHHNRENVSQGNLTTCHMGRMVVGEVINYPYTQKTRMKGYCNILLQYTIYESISMN